jgi:hypothetical protein
MELATLTILPGTEDKEERSNSEFNAKNKIKKTLKLFRFNNNPLLHHLAHWSTNVKSKILKIFYIVFSQMIKQMNLAKFTY